MADSLIGFEVLRFEHGGPGSIVRAHVRIVVSGSPRVKPFDVEYVRLAPLLWTRHGEALLRGGTVVRALEDGYAVWDAAGRPS